MLVDDDIYNLDCLLGLRDVEAASVDMVLADLPYDLTSNTWDELIPFTQLWPELLRVGKEQAVYAFTASQPFNSLLIASQPKLFRHEWIWIKNRGSNFANTVREPFKEHESVLIFSRGKWTYNPQMQERTGTGGARVSYDFNFRSKSQNYREFEGREKQKRDKLRGPSSWQKFNVEVGLHPTQKPVPLFEYLIKTYTAEGALVLDPCFGSGSSLIACLKTGRRFIGFEKDPKYFKVGLARIERFLSDTSQKAINS